jgi:peptide/nickel transport system substrate-binding protein
VRTKYFSFAEELGTGAPTFAPEDAARLLDQAGFPRGPDGVRFRLRYLTTPVREGSELALLVREALAKLGIQLEIVPLEPSLFFSRLKGGDFDLFASRIFRSAGEDPSLELLRTGSPRNYFSYSNATLDSLGDGGRTPGLQELLPFILRDLPWVPLFTWKHALLLSNRIEVSGDPLDSGEDSFRFLRKLRIK